MSHEFRVRDLLGDLEGLGVGGLGIDERHRAFGEVAAIRDLPPGGEQQDQWHSSWTSIRTQPARRSSAAGLGTVNAD